MRGPREHGTLDLGLGDGLVRTREVRGGEFFVLWIFAELSEEFSTLETAGKPKLASKSA